MLTVHPSFIEAKILTRNSFNKIEMIMLFNNFSREENISFCSGLLCLSPLSFSLCIYKHVCESECVSVPPYFMHFFILKSPPFRPSLFCPYNSDTFSRFSRTCTHTHTHALTHTRTLSCQYTSLSLSHEHTRTCTHTRTHVAWPIDDGSGEPRSRSRWAGKVADPIYLLNSIENHIQSRSERSTRRKCCWGCARERTDELTRAFLRTYSSKELQSWVSEALQQWNHVSHRRQPGVAEILLFK